MVKKKKQKQKTKETRIQQLTQTNFQSQLQMPCYGYGPCSSLSCNHRNSLKARRLPSGRCTRQDIQEVDPDHQKKSRKNNR